MRLSQSLKKRRPGSMAIELGARFSEALFAGASNSSIYHNAVERQGEIALSH